MTKYKATPEHWSILEEQNAPEYDVTILELRDRVEMVEKRCEVQLMQLGDLQDRLHRLTMQTRHLENELVKDSEPQQHCLEALE